MKTNGIAFQACPEPATSIPIPRSRVWLVFSVQTDNSLVLTAGLSLASNRQGVKGAIGELADPDVSR